MAQSSIDLKGAKGPKLELDYLRLAYAVKSLREKGNDAAGYLLVMTPDIARRATRWGEKYDALDSVEVIVADLSRDELSIKIEEAAANARSQATVTLGEEYSGGSSADRGKRMAEDSLVRMIENREKGVSQCSDSSNYPMTIAWDYYGTV